MRKLDESIQNLKHCIILEDEEGTRLHLPYHVIQKCTSFATAGGCAKSTTHRHAEIKAQRARRQLREAMFSTPEKVGGESFRGPC